MTQNTTVGLNDLDRESAIARRQQNARERGERMNQRPSLYDLAFQQGSPGAYRPAVSAEPMPAPESNQGFFGDAVDAIQMGAAQAAGGLAETAHQITGSETLGNASQALNNLAKDQISQMSDTGQAAMQKQFFTEDENGSMGFGDAWTDPRAMGLQFMTLVGQMGAQIPLGYGIGTLGAKVAGKVVAKAAAKHAAGRGMTEEAIKHYAQNVTKATFGTAGQSLAGAGIAGGMIGNQARESVLEMSDAELDQSPAFSRAYWSMVDTHPDMDVGQRRDLAKKMVADEVSSAVQRDPMLITTNLVLDAAGGYFIDRILRGVGTGSRLSNAGQQFLAQGATEMGQGGMEQYALNTAMIEQDVDPDRDPMEGVMTNALNEGVLGGAFGGVMGGMSKGNPSENKLPARVQQVDEEGRVMRPIQTNPDVMAQVQPAPTMSLDDALAQIKAERGQYRGIDDDIRIAEEQGFTDEAVRLRAAKRNFEMAADMVAESDLEGAQRFRERGMKIYRDVMEVAAPEYKGGLPAEYVAVGEMVGRAEQLPVPAQAQNGETYEEIETLMPEVADYEPDPARAIPASVDAPYYMETTAEAKAAKAATERAFTEQQGKQPGVRPPVADVDEIPADAESIVLGDVPPPVAEVAELPPLVDVEETNDIPYQRPDIPVSETLQLADEAVPGADAIDFSDDGRADRLAENVQDQIRKHKQPKGLDDGRLLRESFRNQLNHMANRLVRGGGIVQMVDKSGRVTGRTKSLNPDWFQNAPDNVKRLGVQGLQIAVRRSLAGKDLGKGQARAVRYLLDVFTDERNDYARDYLKPERENVLKFRKVMRGQMTAQEAGFVDADTPLARSVGAKQVELSDILEPEILEESFDDDALDSMGRALAEIMQNAKDAGVSDQVLVKAAQEYGHDPIALGMIIEELTERASNGNEITPASIEGFSAGGALEEESAEAEKSAGSGKRKSGAEKSVEPPDTGRASEKNTDEETPAAAGVSVSGGLIRNSAGNPFKNVGAARIALKKHPGYEIAKVDGGYELQRIPEGAAAANNGNMAEPPRTGALDVNDDLAGEIDAAANEAATSPLNDKPEPTAAQIEAGNYEKGHVTVQGLDIAIENPRGSQRSGTDPDDKAWSVTMAHHYGYLKKTEGADGEHIDVYLGKNPESEKVFIVDQVNADGSFDEHKVMLGFTDKAKAIAGYKANYEKGWKVGPVTELTIQQFKDWIAAGDTEKPLSGSLSKSTDKKASQSKKPESDKQAQSQAIEDFGEKLGGARKDEPKGIRERLEGMDDQQIANSTLSQLWPKSEIDKIESTMSAALYHAIREEIPSKPRKGYKLRRWVESVKSARELIKMVENEQSANNFMETMRSKSPQLNTFADKVELLTLVDRKDWPRIGSVNKYSGKYGDGSGKLIPGRWLEVKIDGRRRSFYGKPTPAEAAPEVKKILSAENEAPKMKFEIRGRKDDYRINKTGDSEYRALKSFTNLADARKYMNEQHAELVAAWEAVKQRDNITKSDMRTRSSAPRAGIDRRNGKDVTPEQFSEAFGFRGIEFGNWVSQGKGGRERQGMLNDAYDAFMDLATALSLPPKALSLEGRLGIGFGSRGRGGRAAAHFESDTTVINLTKTQGSGSLAHEWFTPKLSG